MNIFFDEAGDFKTGAILSQLGEAYQVELPGGKRTKVRARDVLLQYRDINPENLLIEAKKTANEIDLNFLWQVAGDAEFCFMELGKEYFGHEPKSHEIVGLLLSLHSSPMYFYRKGKGRYKAAPETALQAALAGMERKKQQILVKEQYVEQLKNGVLPDAMRLHAAQLLFKPDKQSVGYKALHAACEQLQINAERLMLNLGGIASPKELHMQRFLFENFPKGTGFPSVKQQFLLPSLKKADVHAFSIDDATTTEIDDAISVNRLSANEVKVGIHIAVPALGIEPNDAFDSMAKERMSTVYVPGEKITMLPEEVVRVFTLGANQYRPALSLYVTINEIDLSVLHIETQLNEIWIASNLNHNEYDHIITENNLENEKGEYPHKTEISFLWKWIKELEKARMIKRESFGLKAEQKNRAEFSFYVENEAVTITRRLRHAPLDRIISELMIFANSTWGKLLNDCGVPGIYRIQNSGTGGWTNRMQVKMATYAAAHQSLGVDQYIWSTSPLRRYTDLINQWQIIACVKNGATAPLSAPYRHKDAKLYAIVSTFDATYSAYGEFQTKMERYWCLRWLEQNNIHQIDAVVIRNSVVGLIDIPLVIQLPNLPANLAHGTMVKLELLRWDTVDLSVDARLIEILKTGIIDTDVMEETIEP